MKWRATQARRLAHQGSRGKASQQCLVERLCRTKKHHCWPQRGIWQEQTVRNVAIDKRMRCVHLLRQVIERVICACICIDVDALEMTSLGQLVGCLDRC